LLLEKLPLLLLAAGSCLATVWAQGSGGAIKSLDRFPLGLRLANAIDATGCYLFQTFWPVNLAAYYPYPTDGLPWWQVAGTGLLLLAITVAVCWLARTRPYLPVGWFWFLGTLVPVVGLVQVGSQAHADRYTYVPHIGLFLMLVWGLCDLVAAKWRAALLAPLAVAVLAACVVLTRIQVGYWADSLTLWEHTLAVTTDNAFAEEKYGEALKAKGRADEAIVQFKKAIELNPRMYPAYERLADIYLSRGQREKAAECYRQALQAGSDAKRHHNELERLEREQREKKGVRMP
jgi:tetratricopeptide (TPR) repeat protein